MKAKTLLLLPLPLLAACAPKAEWVEPHTQDTITGNVLVKDATTTGFDLPVLDEVVQETLTRLNQMYPTADWDRFTNSLIITVQDPPIPCDEPHGKCKGSSKQDGNSYKAFVSLYYGGFCTGEMKTAHEIGHLARLFATGDSDHDHHDLAFFENDCKNESCKAETLEAITVEGGCEAE
jgi:hypothetical protein